MGGRGDRGDTEGSLKGFVSTGGEGLRLVGGLGGAKGLVESIEEDEDEVGNGEVEEEGGDPFVVDWLA